MADLTSRLDYLVSGFATHQLTAAELDELLALLPTKEAGEAVLDSVEEALYQHAAPGLLTTEAKQALLEQIMDRRVMDHPLSGLSNRIPHRVHFLKTSWFRYAAAIIIILTGFSVYLLYPKKPDIEMAQTTPLPALNEVAPGGQKAILILGDESVVNLDSLQNGSSVQQGDMQIVKSANGEVVYVPLASESSTSGTGNEVVYTNTMKTPNGGQYQLTLPDGTQVWLNAASSITYPTKFIGPQRSVRVSGEVYFEVAKNKEKPFIVAVNTDTKIEVLGTHFNVNAYADEQATRTTLLEGRVKVIQGNKGIVLTPGQQLAGTQLNKQVNGMQVMAWKNGVFALSGKPLHELMRDISRWYDVKVVYEKGIPDVQLGGEIRMDLPLSGVVKFLGLMGVHCRLEQGKRLVVLSN